MDYRLPQVRNLMEQLDLEGGCPRTATRLEDVEGFMVVDRGGEAAIENHRHHLPSHLHKSYTAVVPSPSWDQDHRLSGRLIREDSVLEFHVH